MNKLVRVPSKFNPYLASFSDLIAKSSCVLFCYMITTIAVCDKSKTLCNVCSSEALDPHVNRERFREGLWS